MLADFFFYKIISVIEIRSSAQPKYQGNVSPQNMTAVSQENEQISCEQAREPNRFLLVWYTLLYQWTELTKKTRHLTDYAIQHSDL